jgi:hypothetical protein
MAWTWVNIPMVGSPVAQGRLRVEATKPRRCLSKSTQTLESMQHLFTLSVYTYKVQEGITAHGQSPRRAPRGAPPAVSSQLLWVESARSSILLEGEQSHGRASLTQETESLWQEQAHAGESPLMSFDSGSWASEDTGECTLLCPQQVSFLYDFLLQDVPFWCHLVLCWLVILKSGDPSVLL